MGLAGTRQGKVNTVDFANPDQFDSQVHPGRKMFGEEPVYMWSLEGWGQIKQGEVGEEQSGGHSPSGCQALERGAWKRSSKG